MTDEQKELVYTIQLNIIRAIVNMDPEKTWELIEKILENNGYVEEGKNEIHNNVRRDI